MQLKSYSETFTDIVSAGVSSYSRPCILFRNGKTTSWVDITNFDVDLGYSQDAEYRPDQYLIGISVLQKASGLYPTQGWKYYMGSLIMPGKIMPVPVLPEELLSGPLAYYATWHGRVPAPYGFAVWTHALGSGNYMYITAVLEDKR